MDDLAGLDDDDPLHQSDQRPAVGDEHDGAPLQLGLNLDDTNPFADNLYYLQRNPDVLASGMNR